MIITTCQQMPSHADVGVPMARFRFKGALLRRGDERMT